MKKWAVGFAISIGCQTAGPNAVPTESAEQALEDCYGVGNFCGAGMPQIVPWPGDGLPQDTTSSTVVLLVEVSDKVSAASDNDWLAFGSDPAAGKVRWGLSLGSGELGSFMHMLNGKDQPYGGVRPPPEFCPPACGDFGPRLLENALRMLPIPAQVEAAVKACEK